MCKKIFFLIPGTGIKSFSNTSVQNISWSKAEQSVMSEKYSIAFSQKLNIPSCSHPGRRCSRWFPSRLCKMLAE